MSAVSMVKLLSGGDGFRFMSEHQQEFDVIITDSSDPVGYPGLSARQDCTDFMSGPVKNMCGLVVGGADVIITDSSDPVVWYSLDCVGNTLQHCASVFPRVAYGATCVPTYPSGQIGFVLGSLNKDTNFEKPVRIFSEAELEQMKLRYYSKEVHTSAFQLPLFARNALKKFSS
ncbi:spermidine synthase [Diaphorina citri]|uniref:Spermidine synthase n=1 Tax=Diaphorina citri TaxID=121845 RepID=A0A1S4E8Y7_DIACI|nr:spermidine synthase [Diaphorina citri]